MLSFQLPLRSEQFIIFNPGLEILEVHFYLVGWMTCISENHFFLNDRSYPVIFLWLILKHSHAWYSSYEKMHLTIKTACTILYWRESQNCSFALVGPSCLPVSPSQLLFLMIQIQTDQWASWLSISFSSHCWYTALVLSLVSSSLPQSLAKLIFRYLSPLELWHGKKNLKWQFNYFGLRIRKDFKMR